LSIITILCYPILTFNAHELYSQNENTRDKAIKIFYDCDFCDEEFIKKELTYINYVRDPKEAQVHVLITERIMGVGVKNIPSFLLG